MLKCKMRNVKWEWQNAKMKMNVKCKMQKCRDDNDSENDINPIRSITVNKRVSKCVWACLL